MSKNNSYPPGYDLPAGLAQPAVRALAGGGLTRLDLIAGVTEAEVLKLHGMGPNAMRQIREALNSRGLTFADPKNS
jgi:hypothetical protein